MKMVNSMEGSYVLQQVFVKLYSCTLVKLCTWVVLKDFENVSPAKRSQEADRVTLMFFCRVPDGYLCMPIYCRCVGHQRFIVLFCWQSEVYITVLLAIRGSKSHCTPSQNQMSAEHL